MRNKSLLLLCALGCSLFAAAQRNQSFEYQVSQARYLETAPNFYTRPLVAEIVVDENASHIRDHWSLNAQELASRTFVKNDEATILNLKSYALFKSSEKHNCDLIVVPTFDIRMTENGADITITGYPAKFAKWSTCTTGDYEWILHENTLHPHKAADSSL